MAWNVWYYLPTDTRPKRERDLKPLFHGSVVDFDEEILQTCHSAPSRVHDRVGDLSRFGCWATALLWLAIKGEVPFLHAYGSDLPPAVPPEVTYLDGKKRPPKPKKENPFLAHNRLGIQLQPDNPYVSATTRAFDTLRHFVTDDAPVTHPPSEAEKQKAVEDKVNSESETEERQQFVPTPLQRDILGALDGRAMKKELLAETCKIDPSRLYRPGGIKELMELGKVTNKRTIGYYRPDAPPPDTIELNAPPKRP